MPSILLAATLGYLTIGLLVANIADEAVETRTAVVLGLLWPVTILLVLARALRGPSGAGRDQSTPEPTTRSASGTPKAGPCMITRETPTEYSVRLVNHDDEIGRITIDPLTGWWAAMPADTTQPVLGIYQRGCEAIQALLNQEQP